MRVAVGERSLSSNVAAVCSSQCFQTMAANFGNVFLPFYIHQISPLSPAQTVLWTGWIMGAQGVLQACCAPLWSTLTSYFSPKRLYQRAMVVNMATLAVLPFVSDLRALLVLRVVSGVFGGVSMIGIILIAAASPSERLQANMGTFQASQTLGQMLGPLLGSYCATWLGIRSAFLVAAGGVACSIVYSQWRIVDQRMEPRAVRSGVVLMPWVVVAVALMVVATMQLIFLPSLLPDLLHEMGLTGNDAVRAAGWIVVAYSATAALGAFLIGRWSERVGFLRALLCCVGLCSLLLWALSWAQGPLTFGVIRALQTGAVAGIFPVIMGRAARAAGAGTLGILASSRWAGQSAGALTATSVYARWGSAAVFHVLAAATLLCATAFSVVHYLLVERPGAPKASATA